jgi:hypothetical protein
MSPRDTSTGGVLESMIFPALIRGGYRGTKQVYIGLAPGDKRHRVDVLVDTDNGEQILVSMKWQQTSGTAEEKVPFEVVKLLHALKSGKYKTAYLVLGGNGWSIKQFYLKGGLKEFIPDSDKIHIVDLDTFVALANKGKL